MEEFLNSNEGLRSRIVNFEEIEAMNGPQLGQVLDLMLKKNGYVMEDDAKALALKELESARAKLGPQYFGNAREVRKIVEKLPEQIAERIFGQQVAQAQQTLEVFGKDMFMKATKEDIETLNLPMLLGGKAKEGQKREIGFHAKF